MTSRVEQEAVLPALAGDRSPVLALHGAAGSSRQWQSLADHLGDGCTVIAPDLPGHGSACSQSVRDAAETAERIIGLMAIDGEPMHIVGHSIGAAIALEIAMSRPDLVRSLTLIEPAVFHLLRDGGAADQALFVELSDLAERMARSVEAGDAAGATRAYVDYFCGGGTWDRSGPGPRGGFARQARCVSASLAAYAAGDVAADAPEHAATSDARADGVGKPCRKLARYRNGGGGASTGAPDNDPRRRTYGAPDGPFDGQPACRRAPGML